MKIVKENINFNFDRSESNPLTKLDIGKRWNELEYYIVKVVNGLIEKWPNEKFRKYVDITAESVEKMITDMTGDYTLIKRTVYDLWEDDVSIEDAINELYDPLNRYFSASASVM